MEISSSVPQIRNPRGAPAYPQFCPFWTQLTLGSSAFFISILTMFATPPTHKHNMFSYSLLLMMGFCPLLVQGVGRGDSLFFNCVSTNSQSVACRPDLYVSSKGLRTWWVLNTAVFLSPLPYPLPFSIAAVSIYIPTNSARAFPFLHTLSSIYCL